MTALKICGITGEGDALAAAALGVEALGFIFYRGSPRYVEPETVRGIADALGKRYPAGVRPFPLAVRSGVEGVPLRPALIGVFVNEDPEEVKRIAAFCHLDMLQFHGDETPAYCRLFPRERVIKALTVDDKTDPYDVAAIVLDSRLPGRYGGTGRTVDWEKAAAFRTTAALILSGGLNGDNITAALQRVAPNAVDVNSGVEIAPGRKDLAKMARFVAALRHNDEKWLKKTGG